MHFCLTWPLTASAAFWPLVMIDAMSMSLQPICQLPIARLALLGLSCTSRDSTATCTVPAAPNPVVHVIHVPFFFSFFSLFILLSFLTRLSTVHCIHPHRTNREAHPPVGLMHLCMSWKIPLTGYEISEIATKQPRSQRSEVRRQTPEEATSQDAATHSRTRTHAHTLTPPPGPLGGPLHPLPFPFPPAGLSTGTSARCSTLPYRKLLQDQQATRLDGWPKKAADVTLRFRSDFFDVWPNPTRYLWTALDCNGPGCPWTAHGLPTGCSRNCCCHSPCLLMYAHYAYSTAPTIRRSKRQGSVRAVVNPALVHGPPSYLPLHPPPNLLAYRLYHVS